MPDKFPPAKRKHQPGPAPTEPLVGTGISRNAAAAALRQTEISLTGHTESMMRTPEPVQETINRLGREIAEEYYVKTGQKLEKQEFERRLSKAVRDLGLPWKREINRDPAFEALPEKLRYRQGRPEKEPK